MVPSKGGYHHHPPSGTRVAGRAGKKTHKIATSSPECLKTSFSLSYRVINHILGRFLKEIIPLGHLASLRYLTPLDRLVLLYPHDIHHPPPHPEVGLAGEVRQLCRLPDCLRAWMRYPTRMHGPWKALPGQLLAADFPTNICSTRPK